MNTLFTILAVLVVIASILLTLVVLLQNGKGGGLASNFVAGNQTFGVRQTADLLEKITWGLAIFVLVISIVSNFAQSTKGQSETMVSEQDLAPQEQTLPEFPQNNPEALPLMNAENPEAADAAPEN